MMQFFPASARDMNSVTSLLRWNALPTGDIDIDKLSHFLVCRDDAGELQACAGAELFADIGLLRSVAVVEAQRSKGFGGAAVDAVERYTAARGVQELYLLTTTAALFFERRGYRRVDRQGVPEPLRQTAEFASLCPSSAICLCKTVAATTAIR